MRHYNIPIFIPELGCPHRCVFCNQQNISGVCAIPMPADVAEIIHQHLATFKEASRRVEVAFFGGSFTGLPAETQQAYLDAAKPFFDSGKVESIRLSTRPDYINQDILELLKRNNVGTIELGAQSMDDAVLAISNRGHSSAQVEIASKQILEMGFELGLQMMVGLPGDSFEKTMSTARRFVELGASQVRIYPALVIRNTPLEEMFIEKKYCPLALQEAVEQCKHLILFFESHGVKILRVGLHPSEGLLNGDQLVAGPFHPAFKELVETSIWNDLLKEKIDFEEKCRNLVVWVSSKGLNAAIGHGKANKIWLEKYFEKVYFKIDPVLEGRRFHVCYS